MIEWLITSITEARNRYGEVFDQAMTEPVMLTKQSRPSHVILSAQAYEQLIDRLEQLEDAVWGQAAEQELERSQMIGSDRFVVALEQFC